MNQPAHNLPLPDYLKQFAHELRQSQTDAERLMWGLLRDRRFLNLKFRRQHPVDQYLLDFYCYELQWAVELDGGQHNSPEARLKDQKRSDFLATRGILVSRYWNHDVLGDFETVVEAMFRTAMKLKNPLPPSEG